MAGTKAGGLKARKTNYKRHGRNFYRQIGAKGGKNGHTGGFAANPELASICGRKGGLKSRRGTSKKAAIIKPSQKQKPIYLSDEDCVYTAICVAFWIFTTLMLGVMIGIMIAICNLITGN